LDTAKETQLPKENGPKKRSQKGGWKGQWGAERGNLPPIRRDGGEGNTKEKRKLENESKQGLVELVHDYELKGKRKVL